MPHPRDSRTRAVRAIMSPVKVLRQEVHVSEHEPASHAPGDAAHGGHDPDAAVGLGPIDWAAWAMAVVGGGLGLLVAVSLVIAGQG
jgi:hypothetical protein